MTLDARTTELVAIGASITADCLSCLEHHLGKAAEAGVAEPEIAEAVHVAKRVRKGATDPVDQLLEHQRRPAASVAGDATGGCCA